MHLSQELEKMRGSYKKDSTTTAPFFHGKDQVRYNKVSFFAVRLINDFWSALQIGKARAW